MKSRFTATLHSAKSFMRKSRLWSLAFALVLAASNQRAMASFVAIEAESGTLGSEWAVSNSASPSYITITSTGAGNNPGSSNRVATYSVTFPAAGSYQLYARLRTGAGAFNDDSMFFATSFGAKSPTNNADWFFVNGLAGVGFSNNTDIVTGAGTLGSGMWKWINLSQFVGQSSFNVTAGNFTQTFQIGAREDGLDLDRFVFGSLNYTFTVANLNNGTDGAPPPAPVATVYPANLHQTIEGFGGAIAFYNGWVTAHPYKDEIMTNAFAGLNLSMLRLGNWFRYQGTTNFDPDAPGFVTKANQVLGRPVQVLMSSWAPPAFLKSNGQVGNGGTLLYTNGGFAYNEFAQYWYDSLVAYRNIGVSPNWVSIQNEPDWEASYDSCIFRPTEGMYNGTNWAGYSNALSATYLKVATLPSPPKFLGPEPVGIGYSVPQNYAATMNPNHFYGFNYHLYHGSTDGSANGYVTALRATTNLFSTKPRFMTEFGVSNMIESATLIHNCLTEGQVSGYNHWSLIWPNTDGGLIQIEFPWSQAQWTNAPPGTPTQSKGYWLTPAYWAMKHFSYYVTPGSRRIAATNNDPNIKTSAYLTEDNLRLVAVFINRNLAATAMDLNFAAFPYASSGVYQTAGTNKFQSLGAAGSQLTLPPESLTTVVLDKFVAVGPASNPSPANGAASVALNTGFNWTAGSNALLHAVYRGLSSNAVFTATPASAEFKGYATNNSLAATALSGSSTYYWRVDGIAGANTNAGTVWSFSTVAGPVTNSILPVADSFVESSTATSNYGSLTNVTVKNNVTVATRAAYLMFDVRSLSNVQSATLKLLPNRVDDSAVLMFYEVAATNWTEAGINWNNQPGGTGQYFATNTVTLNVPVTFNVTSLVANKATNGGLFSIRISQPTNSLNGLIMFCSKECSVTNLRPVLEYVIPPNSAPTLATNSNRTLGAGMVLSVTNNATDTDTPAQTLTFSLLTAPTNTVPLGETAIAKTGSEACGLHGSKAPVAASTAARRDRGWPLNVVNVPPT